MENVLLSLRICKVRCCHSKLPFKGKEDQDLSTSEVAAQVLEDSEAGCANAGDWWRLSVPVHGGTAVLTLCLQKPIEPSEPTKSRTRSPV